MSRIDLQIVSRLNCRSKTIRNYLAARKLSAAGSFFSNSALNRPTTCRVYPTMEGEKELKTRILQVDVNNIGKVTAIPRDEDILDELKFSFDETPDVTNLQIAAEQLKHSNVPVAFPTETVYGLGADATRSKAVQGIYKAKQRPSDNPLIVHFYSLAQLRDLLRPASTGKSSHVNGYTTQYHQSDPIPEIYRPLITKFWPGPLTIILPNPPNSSLAPEVTAGLTTFGARIPRNVLALALINISGRPIAAPSANASTKPSPTSAEHVAHDLDGRIETIIDGGLCDVGVESTVVDGLSTPPLVLRPGGISLEQLRSCPGWENTEIGYKTTSELNGQPKAPGMKYRHYSPRAPVILFEADERPPDLQDLLRRFGTVKRLGVITTKKWHVDAASSTSSWLTDTGKAHSKLKTQSKASDALGFAAMLETYHSVIRTLAAPTQHNICLRDLALEVLEIDLGIGIADIARGIFSALRELDRRGVDAIAVEGIDENEGDTAAAVMNRLRKAAKFRSTD